MATPHKGQRSGEASRRLDRATFDPADYGRMMRADGTEQWWVRSSGGGWIALSHQRVVENDDGTITLLYLD
jgi:hypothetical protein